MDSRYTSVVYYACNIATEVMGIFICNNSFASPDLLPAIKYSLYACLAVDITRALVSLLAILFALIWGTTAMADNVKSNITTAAYILTGIGLVASVGLCVFYELNYANTDMAATPWLSFYYYIGVAAYALMKTILFVTGGLYFAVYVNSLPKPVYAAISQRSPTEMTQQKYMRVPVYPPQY